MQPNNQKNVSNSKEPSEFSLSKGDIAHFNPIHRVIIPIKSTIIVKKGFAMLDYFKNSSFYQQFLLLPTSLNSLARKRIIRWGMKLNYTKDILP